MTDLAALAHFRNYSPGSFGWNNADPFTDAGELVEFEHAGVSFGMMNRNVVHLFHDFLDELIPMIPAKALTAGKCGCYNPRSISSGGSRSFHSWGIAIDINWDANPMGVPNRPTGDHALPAATGALARKYGMEWGGDWDSPKDWMHVEIHLTPADARAYKPEGFHIVNDNDRAEIAAIVHKEVRSVLHGDTNDDGKTDTEPASVAAIVRDELADALAPIKSQLAALTKVTAAK